MKFLMSVVVLSVDVIGDVFCLKIMNAALLAHKGIVDIFGETRFKNLYTSVGIAQL